MPEDSTRRLLRVFGMAVTDCEDALVALEAASRGSEPAPALGAALEAFERAAGDLEARWTEVGRLIQGYQGRGRAALAAALRARGAA
jgi:hypothetical protein